MGIAWASPDMAVKSLPLFLQWPRLFVTGRPLAVTDMSPASDPSQSFASHRCRGGPVVRGSAEHRGVGDDGLEVWARCLQGVQVRRPCHIHVNVTMAGGDVTGVKVGGGAVVVGEGAMAT